MQFIHSQITNEVFAKCSEDMKTCQTTDQLTTVLSSAFTQAMQLARPYTRYEIKEQAIEPQDFHQEKR